MQLDPSAISVCFWSCIYKYIVAVSGDVNNSTEYSVWNWNICPFRMYEFKWKYSDYLMHILIQSVSPYLAKAQGLLSRIFASRVAVLRDTEAYYQFNWSNVAQCTLFKSIHKHQVYPKVYTTKHNQTTSSSKASHSSLSSSAQASSSCEYHPYY